MEAKSGPLIIVLGPQGSGKGTQAQLLSERCHIPNVSAGDLLREAATKPTDLGRAVAALLRAGQLVTIDQWEAVVRSYLNEHDLSAGYLLDGVVRSLEQVSRFDELLTKKQLSQPWILFINLDDAVATERLLKRNRDDDTASQIRERLAWSRTQVEPVIDHYRSLGRVVEVNGDQTIEQVHAEIIDGLADIGALPKVKHG